MGAILGIVLGGIITTFIGWRFIFYINVPIGIAAIALGGIREVKDYNVVKRRFDVPGTVLLAASLALIAYGAANVAGGVGGVNSPRLGYTDGRPRIARAIRLLGEEG